MIKRVRDEATEEGLQIFTWELIKHAIGEKMTDDRIFNMDETGFAHNNKTRKFIAVAGSKNVWPKSVEASFHMTIVACVAAVDFLFLHSSFSQFND